jgi:hypothetical protein
MRGAVIDAMPQSAAVPLPPQPDRSAPRSPSAKLTAMLNASARRSPAPPLPMHASLFAGSEPGSGMGTPQQTQLRRQGSIGSAASSARRRPNSRDGCESFATSGSFEMPAEQEACITFVDGDEYDDEEEPVVPMQLSSSPGAFGNRSLSTPPRSRCHQMWPAPLTGPAPAAGAPSVLYGASPGVRAPFEPTTPMEKPVPHFAGRRVAPQPAGRESDSSPLVNDSPAFELEEQMPAAPALPSAPVAGVLMSTSGTSGSIAARGKNSRVESSVDFPTAYRSSILAHRSRARSQTDGHHHF